MIKIQILGTGCAKCERLAENAEFAARESGMEFEIEKVSDLNRISEFGVRATPALVIDGEVKVAGKAAGVDEIKRLMGYKLTCG